MPATRKRWYLGARPRGVSSPWGLVTRTLIACLSPICSASSLPMTRAG